MLTNENRQKIKTHRNRRTTSKTHVSIIRIESVEDSIPMLSFFLFPLFLELIEIDAKTKIDTIITPWFRLNCNKQLMISNFAGFLVILDSMAINLVIKTINISNHSILCLGWFRFDPYHMGHMIWPTLSRGIWIIWPWLAGYNTIQIQDQESMETWSAQFSVDSFYSKFIKLVLDSLFLRNNRFFVELMTFSMNSKVISIILRT